MARATLVNPRRETVRVTLDDGSAHDIRPWGLLVVEANGAEPPKVVRAEVVDAPLGQARGG